MSKKPIRSSNLCLRFYVSDGWTEQELKECLKVGRVGIAHPNDKDPYYTAEVGSYFDCKKLLDKCSFLDRAFNDIPNESDIQFMERHN